MYSNWEYNVTQKCKTHQDKHLRMKTAGSADNHCIYATSLIKNTPVILVTLTSDISLPVFKEER